MGYRFWITFRASIDLSVRFYVFGRLEHMSKDGLTGLKISIVKVAGSKTAC